MLSIKIRWLWMMWLLWLTLDVGVWLLAIRDNEEFRRDMIGDAAVFFFIITAAMVAFFCRGAALTAGECED